MPDVSLRFRATSRRARSQLTPLEHKETAGRTTFDALVCLGSSDYAKCSRNLDGSWAIQEVKTRGSTSLSTEKLRNWILTTFPTDRLETLPPVTTDIRLLGFKEAAGRGRQFLRQGATTIAFPLGHSDSRVRIFQAIRLSAYIPRDEQQLKTLERQFDKFFQKYHSGFEILALRRAYAGRPGGSLTAIAQKINKMIQEG